MTDIQTFVNEHPVIDVHEHHMPEPLLNRDVGLVQLFDQSYAGWTRAQPPAPRLSSWTPSSPEREADATWNHLAGYLEDSGSTSFVRNLVQALTELYELGEEGITPDNWRTLDEAVRRRHADPSWVPSVLDRAGIRRVITDPYNSPMLDVREALGERYRSVLRTNALALGWHPRSRDHNGNTARALLQTAGLEPATFDAYLEAIERLVDTLADRGQVALKNALAYDRPISFDEPDEKLARAAWGQLRPHPDARKAFGDYIVDHLCRLAGQRDIPVQMHLGTALVRGSHPMNVAGLLERHPRTRFLLMHLAYPWSADLFALAFGYRNVWLDLTWAPLLSPSHFQRALHEAIEILPDESRLMIGGDNWHAEETYGSIGLMRRLIGQVLHEKVEAGYFAPADARRLAGRILHDNAEAFFEN